MALASLVLPCTPKANDEETYRTLETVKNIFRACCPSTLEVNCVEPKVGRGRIYKCWWYVTYQNKEEPQPLIDSEIAERLEDAAPRGSHIIAISKTIIPTGWVVLYRKKICHCHNGLASKCDLKDLPFILDSKLKLEN